MKRGLKAAQEPDQFEIAGGLGFEAAAGAQAVEVAVEIKLEQIRRVIGRAAGGGGLGAREAERLEIQAFDIGVKEACRGVGGDVILQAGREELDLGAVRAAEVAHGDAGLHALMPRTARLFKN